MYIRVLWQNCPGSLGTELNVRIDDVLARVNEVEPVPSTVGSLSRRDSWATHQFGGCIIDMFLMSTRSAL